MNATTVAVDLAKNVIGMTQPLAPRRIMTWLPDWRIFSKPRRDNVRIITAPET